VRLSPTLTALAAVPVFALTLTGCGGGDTAASSETATTPEAPPPPSLSRQSTCEAWQLATAADQRAFAATFPEPDVARTITSLNRACTPANKALTIVEAVRLANTPPPDPFAATRVAGAERRYIAQQVRESWNRCGPDDVCIPGERARSVGCSQPDPQVRVLSCFVTTQVRGDGESYGYSVKVNVASDGSFNWRIDRS
jgi:hypothetical protein